MARQLTFLGMPDPEVGRVFRTFNAWAEPFRAESAARLADSAGEETA
jgi:hypothetical protein